MKFFELFQNIEKEAINFVARRNKSLVVYFIKSGIILYLATIIPGYMFMVIEGQMEDEFKEHIYPETKADIIKRMYILGQKNLDDKEYHQNAKIIIIGYETQIQQWIRDYPIIIENLQTKIWTLWNAFFYSYTVYTSLGYGELYPITTVGKCSTIIYTLIGLPLFVIFLNDLGKIITDMVKLIWLYMRRLYHTGSLWKRRKDLTVSVFQEPRTIGAGDPSEIGNVSGVSPTVTKFSDIEETLSTQDISTFQEDQDYTLSIPVALFALTIYIFLGALMYSAWEGWTFFESFYFVFICLSTVGFGDFIPHHPTCQVVTIFYDCFGKALMAMCITVFQEKLSESFQSVKSDSMIEKNLDMDSDSGQSFDILDMKAGSSVEQILDMEEKEEAKRGIIRTKSYYKSTTFGKLYADINANPIIDVPIIVEENKDIAVLKKQERPDPNIMATIPESIDV